MLLGAILRRTLLLPCFGGRFDVAAWPLSALVALVWALHPQVAIFNNGPRKGASPAAWQIVHDAPGLKDVWQLHYAQESDRDHNIDAERIANVKENCEGKFLKVLAGKDGTFTVENGRTGVQKKYSRK